MSSRFRVEVKGNEFGETYHTALAVITCAGAPAPVEPLWYQDPRKNPVPPILTTKPDQKRFLGKVALYMQLRKSQNPDLYVDEYTIERFSGFNQGADVTLSSNGASAETAKAFANITPAVEYEYEQQRKLIRNVFLFNPAVPGLMSSQMKLDGILRKSIADELVKRGIDKTNDKVIIFNRQQTGSENRNLTSDMLAAIIKHAKANKFLINSVPAEEAKFDKVWKDMPKDVKQGKEYTHLGGFIQGKLKKDGIKDEAFNLTDGYTFQLNVLDVLNKEFKAIGAYGVKSGALDGSAFVGIATFYCLGVGDTDGRVKYLSSYFPYGRLP